MEQARGIVLKLTKLTETSLIVTCVVEGRGLVKVVARGARRPKSAFAGCLDLFYEVDLWWVESRKSELGQLREVRLIEDSHALSKRYANVLCASYFSALLMKVMELGQAEDRLFELMQRAMGYLRKQPADWRGLVHFERELVRIMGVWSGHDEAAMVLRDLYGNLPHQRESCMDLFGDA